MPTAAEGLQAGTDNNTAKAAIGKCISQLVEEGKDQEQAAAICYSQARESSGNEFGYAKKQGTKRITGGVA